MRNEVLVVVGGCTLAAFLLSAGAAVFFGIAYLIMMVWNAILPQATGGTIPEINFWVAVGLWAIVVILVNLVRVVIKR